MVLTLPLFLISAPVELQAPVAELARREVCVDATYSGLKGKPLEVADRSCKPVVTDSVACPSKLSLALTNCRVPEAGSLQISEPGGTSVTVSIAAAEKCALVLAGGDLKLRTAAGAPLSPYTGTLFKLDKLGLQTIEVAGGKLGPTSISDGAKVWATAGSPGAGGVCMVDVAQLSATPVDAVAGAEEDLGAPPELAGARKNLDEFCSMTLDDVRKAEFGDRREKRHLRRLRRETICVWTDGQGKYVTVFKSRQLLPGRPIRFVLRGPPKLKLRARQEGTIGYSAELDDHTAVGASLEDPARAVAEGAVPEPSTTQVWEFEGRGPGLAPIVLEKEPGKEAHRIELDLPKTYMGSLRIGMAIVGNTPAGRTDGLRAVVPEYAGVKRPGSSTYEVVEKKDSKLAWELVLAYSVYPEAMLGGRNYRDRLFSRNNWGVGPVVGLGIVSVANAKVDVFKSLYLGLEFEPVRYFSISAGPVFRRVDVLADGVRVGSALTDATVPTKERIGIGWFFMLTVSPKFMKTASPGK